MSPIHANDKPGVPMKSLPLITLVLTALLSACGDPSEADSGQPGSGGSAGSSSNQRITDPSKLPSDQEGLAEIYKSLLVEVSELIEGIETKQQLDTKLDELAGMGPAFNALMTRSEELNLSVEDSINDELDELSDRMEKASRDLVRKFPREAMPIMNAFASATGGVGPK